MVRLSGLACALWTGLAVIPAQADEIAARAVKYQPNAIANGDHDAVRSSPRERALAMQGKAPLSRRAAMVKMACDEISVTARTYRLPPQFLLRLIWQESRFNPQAVSPVGAQGIAQFMPATAQWRGLGDPFDWSLSIQHSGRWLAELRQQFGNSGLAAAAYNAGPGRVREWLAGSRELPEETQAYVRVITGRKADDWIGVRDVNEAAGFESANLDCPPRGDRLLTVFHAETDAHSRNMNASRASGVAARNKPFRGWALQLIGDRSRFGALRQYDGLRRQYPTIFANRAPEVVARRIGGRLPTFWYQIRVSEVSRQGATKLCSHLKSVGGQCLVIPN